MPSLGCNVQERPTRPAPDEARPSGVDGDELHADGRLPLPVPDAEPDDDFPDPEGVALRLMVLGSSRGRVLLLLKKSAVSEH